jgi:hypothetical protein
LKGKPVLKRRLATQSSTACRTLQEARAHRRPRGVAEGRSTRSGNRQHRPQHVVQVEERKRHSPKVRAMAPQGCSLGWRFPLHRQPASGRSRDRGRGHRTPRTNRSSWCRPRTFKWAREVPPREGRFRLRGKVWARSRGCAPTVIGAITEPHPVDAPNQALIPPRSRNSSPSTARQGCEKLRLS